jgi:hypothetical protein
MIDLLIIPYMAVMSGWSGGSLKGHKLFGPLDFIPEILFSLGFVYAYISFGYPALLIAIWSYGWMQAATANGLHWGDGFYKPDRDTSFSPIVNWISDRLNLDRNSVNYCRLYMGVKGFLITLPVGGILGFILWPLGYEIGHRFGKHVISELLSGGGAGVCIYLFMELIYA